MTSRVAIRRFSALLAVLAVLSAAAFSIILAAGARSKLAVLSAVATAGSYDVGAPVVLAHSPRIVLERGAVSLLPLGSGSTWLALLTGSRDRIVLDGATLSVELASSATPARLSGGEAEPWRGALEEGRFESLSLRRATIVVRTENGAIERLENVDADIGPRQGGALKAEGALTFRGETLSFGAALGPEDDKVPGGGRAARLKLKSSILNAEIEGRLTAVEGLKFAADRASLAAPSLRETARWLGASWSKGRALENFRATGEFEWSSRTVSFQNAAMEMDGNRAKGNLTLSFEGERLALDGTLAFGELNLTPYLERASGNEDAAGAALAAAGDASDGSSIPLFKSIDADIRISTERVSANGAGLGRGAATLSLANGRLLAELADIELSSGGGGEGQINLDMTGPEARYGLRGKFEALDASAASQALFGFPVMQGRLDTTFDLVAQGWSSDRFRSTLAGKLDIEAPDACRIGIDAEALASVGRGGARTGWDFARRGPTPVDWLLGRFTFGRGVATAHAFVAGAGAKKLSATGTIDLSARALDLRLEIRPRLGVAPGNPSSEDVFVGIAGPWASPEFKPASAEKAARASRPAPPIRNASGAQ